MCSSLFEANAVFSDGWWAVTVPRLPSVCVRVRKFRQVSDAALREVVRLVGRAEQRVSVRVRVDIPEVNEVMEIVHFSQGRDRESPEALDAAVSSGIRALDARGYAREDIAALFGVSPWFVWRTTFARRTTAATREAISEAAVASKVVERATPGHHSKGRSAVTGTDRGDDVSDMTLLDGTPLTVNKITKLVAEAEAGGEPAPAEDSHLTPVAKIRRPTKSDTP